MVKIGWSRSGKRTNKCKKYYSCTAEEIKRRNGRNFRQNRQDYARRTDLLSCLVN